MTTLIPCLLETLPQVKFVRCMISSSCNSASYIPHRWMSNTTHNVNRVKMLHTMHSYLFVQHHFHRTNPIIHMNLRLQYANTKLTSPYYMNYSYIIQPNRCEGTLRNFDPIEDYFVFSPLDAKTKRPILVPTEYLQCVEGGATKCTHGHNFNLLPRRLNWIIAKPPTKNLRS